MSEHGSIQVTFTFFGDDAANRARRAAAEVISGKGWLYEWSVVESAEPGKCMMWHYDDQADWLRDEVEGLSAMCSKLVSAGFKADTWMVNVVYNDYEDPDSDGSHIEFDIRDGKLCNWKENRVVIVDCDPWVDIEFSISGVGAAGN